MKDIITHLKNNILKTKSLYLVVIFLILILFILLFNYSKLRDSMLGKKNNERIKTSGEIRAIWKFSIYGYKDNKFAKLNFPYGVAVDKKRNIYISDSGSGRILIFSSSGKYLRQFNGRIAKDGQLHTPLGIDVSQDGKTIIVADKRLSKVVIYDDSFNVLKEIKENFPILPVISRDKIYVTTYRGISIYNIDGKLISKWGQKGKRAYEFDFPNGLAFDNKKNIYVSDSNNHRIKSLLPTGDIRWVEGKPLKTMYQRQRRFDLPAGLAVDDNNLIYLVDTFDCSIRILDGDAREIAKIGDFGTGEGRFFYPIGIEYGGDNRFYIVDRGNNRMQAIDILLPRKRGFIGKDKESSSKLLNFILGFHGYILAAITLFIFYVSYLIIKRYTEEKA